MKKAKKTIKIGLSNDDKQQMKEDIVNFGIKATAEVTESDTGGTKVNVTSSVEEGVKIFNFDFENLKGANGQSCTHEWNGTKLTITSASGTSTADLKGEPGCVVTMSDDGILTIKY